MARMTSRLEKRERQKLLKQTVLFFSVAIVIGLAFVFLILPNFIKILTTFFSQTDATVVTDTIPPQRPTLSSPPEATASAKLEVSGYSEPDSTVFFILNGQEVATTTAQSDGKFVAELPLSEGENSLTTYATDKANNESETTTPVRIIFDATPPDLEITTPQDGTRFEGARNQTVTITGTTDSDAHIVLNGRSVFPKNDGSFSTTYFLSEGENSLEFVALDRAGNETKQTIMVVFTR